MDARTRQRRNFLLGLGLAVAVILRLTAPRDRRIPPPPTPTAQPADPMGGARAIEGQALSERARTVLAERLAAAPRGSPVWLAASALSPGSVRLAEDLAAVFTRAGWDVRGIERTDWAIRPGIFLYAADPTPPAYFETARAALPAAGLELAGVGTDYRAYYAERQSQPNWRGLAMGADQTWVLMIGRLQ